MALTFFWRCEGATLDGTHDYSAGDTTGDAGARGGAINTDTVKVGTNSHDCGDGDAYYEFALSSDIILSEGAVGFWYYANSLWQAGQIIWQAIDASASTTHIYLIKSGSSGSGGFSLDIGDAGQGNDLISTGDIGMATGNWYFVTFGWDETNTSAYIHVFDDTLTQLAAATESTSFTASYYPPIADLDSLRLGHQSGTSEAGSFDNYFVADAYDEDLVSNANITSYTLYGGGGGTSFNGLSLLGVS